MAQRRQAAKAIDASVHIGIGGTALILRFVTLKEGEFTVAVPIEAARMLARALDVKADEAAILASEGAGKPRH